MAMEASLAVVRAWSHAVIDHTRIARRPDLSSCSSTPRGRITSHHYTPMADQRETELTTFCALSIISVTTGGVER